MPNTKQDSKPLSEKLKAFFRVGSKSGFPDPRSYELQLDPQLLEDLSGHQPVSTRVRTIRELTQQVREKKLQQHGAQMLWYKISDLLDQDKDRETRQVVLEFLTQLVIGQFESSDMEMMRPVLFKFIRSNNIQEDLDQKIQLLIALTENGKHIVHIEEQLGRLLLEMFDCHHADEATLSLLMMTSNMVKYNSAYLDQRDVISLILRLNKLSCSSSNDQEILQCLEIFKCVIMYSFVPAEALVPYISSLCKVVNLSSVASDAWDTMRKLMGTHLGHSALYQLCQIIRTPDNSADTALIRGALFFIGQSLWGAHRISSLKYSPMAVLPVFCTALDTNPHQLILYEVVLQLERLVTSTEDTITAPSWEEAVSVLELLVTKISVLDSEHSSAVHHHLQATIGQLEKLAMTDSYGGSRTRLYSLVESVSHISPDSSVIHLIKYQQSMCLHPGRDGWCDKLASMMERLYCQETRVTVRLVMMSVLSEVVTSNMLLWEDQLLEKSVLPFLSNIERESDRVVRVQSVQLVSTFASKSSGSHLTDLVDILEKIVRRFSEAPAGVNSSDTAVVFTKHDFDIQCEAVRGLIQCMKSKLSTGPGSVVKRCFTTLVSTLDNIYERPQYLECTGDIRLEIFRMLLTIRANRDYHLGLPRSAPVSSPEHGADQHLECTGHGQYCFSPHVVCDRGEEQESVTDGTIVISVSRGCLCVLRCLRDERDWSVLGHVLESLPGTLQNKGLLSRYGKNISLFASALCSLFVPSHPLPTLNTPVKFARPEFHCAIYPVLAALASYNRNLDHDLKTKLIKCFECGLLSRTSNKVSIVALTAFIFQMSGSMYKLLPDVLLNLSKMSATVHIAIPMLEFLSTLISLPKVFASFDTKQFLSVFAITLPYTNPFKFNHYTVSLAHHVIIMWFLKCRLNNRRDFVKFIIKGLSSNVLQPFEEGNFRNETSLSSLNEDSSGRTRSSSASASDTSSRRQRHMTGLPSRPALNRNSGPDERQALLTFHQELTETCVDLMARYSFSNCGVTPGRSSVTAWLLSQGQSCSWILGTMIITVTVSGCAQSSNKAGFCDTCYQFCRPETSDQETTQEPRSRGRHRSEAALSRRGSGQLEDNVAPLESLVKDDSHVSVSRRGSLVQSGAAGLEHTGQLELLQTSGGQAPAPGSVSQCGCWCQGWCELMIRRPAGVTSWVCRVQNGVLSNQPGAGYDTVADITNILAPELEKQAGHKRDVERSKSTSIIGDPLPLKTDKCSSIAEEQPENGVDQDPPATPRPRAFTLSAASTPSSRGTTSSSGGGNGAISPQFMFLQLYQATGLASVAGGDKPIMIPNTKSVESSLKILDRIFCYETHKVGVIYVGQGQISDESAILSNQFGSSRYASFLSGLGTLVDITTTDQTQVFLGGLDPRDDGQFHIVWQDDAMQVVYHTATLMPSSESDPQFNKKKRHIGNDYVAIVYNDGGDKYKMGTVKGQFIYAHIIIEPLDFESNRISVECKPELQSELGHLATPKIVSDSNLSRHVRQMALHCNLAAVIHVKTIYNKGDPYASNWLERLRHIKRLKNKVLKEVTEDEESSGLIHDFTGYV